MELTEKRALQRFARRLRIDALNEVHDARAGHIGGSLSICDTLAYLYQMCIRDRTGTACTAPRWTASAAPSACPP